MEEIIALGKKHGIAIYVLIILMTPEAKMNDLVENYETLSKWVLEDGVQISVEPVMYPYRGTEVFDQDAAFHYEWEKRDGVEYRDAKWIWPNDPRVRALCEELIEKRETFVANYFKDLPHQHHFKGATGVALISLLGELLRKKVVGYKYKGL
jgi:hypothetical protein